MKEMFEEFVDDFALGSPGCEQRHIDVLRCTRLPHRPTTDQAKPHAKAFQNRLYLVGGFRE